ncbi:MAG: hypothetical protein GXP05_13425 [Alphaproteobacteria bacterium]|nr:hypothetical protein [Alphaproteobacteria bacterium]
MIAGDAIATGLAAFNTLIAALIWFKLGRLEGEVSNMARFESRLTRLEGKFMGKSRV